MKLSRSVKLRYLPFLKLTLKILRSVDANNLSLIRCAKEYGWHVTLLRQITGPFGRSRGTTDVSKHNTDVKEEQMRGEEDLIDTVLEIVFRVMWKGVEGFRECDWKVMKPRCLVFATTHIHSWWEIYRLTHSYILSFF